MQTAPRKRSVSSCISCYTRKQKCNRRYPCNHCARRRRPEQCAYYPSQALQVANVANVPNSPVQADHTPVDGKRSGGSLEKHGDGHKNSSIFPGLNESTGPTNGHLSLANHFGYFEESKSNTMALVRRFGVHEDQDWSSQGLSHEIAAEMQQSLRRMPVHPVLDFLVQYFVTQVNWIDQVVHPPWFLAHYQRWWTIDSPSVLGDVEFAVLLLRIVSYASEFLPSPTYTVDRVRGMLLADIRTTCDEIADNLAAICTRLDSRGSLPRVQHIVLAGLKAQCEGRINTFWEALSSAILVAQRVGIHQDAAATVQAMDELEKEMRRRSLCNLYIWDSLLSRQLDRIPFLPDGLTTESMPRMHLVADIDDPDAPEEFTARFLQARLVDFWRSCTPRTGASYDVIMAEETYERFCNEFLPTLPPAFSLRPNRMWDERLPMLPLQRQALHITLFDCLCFNFRPALLQEPSHVQHLPKYKQVMLSSQRKALAVSALRVLERVTTLHTMLGGSHTRYVGVIFPTFEAAVLLVCLYIDHDFSEREESRSDLFKTDPLAAGMASFSREECMAAAQDALSRLRTLAEVSCMADVGARTLTRLIEKATASPVMAPAPEGAIWSSMLFPEYADLDSLPDLLSLTATDVTYPN